MKALNIASAFSDTYFPMLYLVPWNAYEWQTKRLLSTLFLDIVWISPVFGSRVTINPDSGHRYWACHCDTSDDSGRSGIAIALSERNHSALIEWKTISDRMTALKVSSVIPRTSVPICSYFVCRKP